MHDYRFAGSQYNKSFFDLKEKKELYMKDLKRKHPRAKDIYNIIKTKSNTENEDFRYLYNNTCVYCGVNIKVIDSSKFEVDHVIPKSILKTKVTLPTYLSSYTEAHIHNINNLVCSCQACNRWKTAFFCNDEKNTDILHPDEDKLHTIFFRNDNYEITMYEKYKDIEDIVQFYEMLKLGSQIRRIDYLLVEINDYIDSLDKTDKRYNLISDLLRKIERKRRLSS